MKEPTRDKLYTLFALFYFIGLPIILTILTA